MTSQKGFRSVFVRVAMGLLLTPVTLWVLGYVMIDDDSKSKLQFYPSQKVNSSEIVEIRPALINDRIQHDPTLPSYVELGSVYWANSSGSDAVEGIAGYYCFIGKVAWIPCTGDAMESVSRYVRLEGRLNSHNIGKHLANAPEWYKRKDQR